MYDDDDEDDFLERHAAKVAATIALYLRLLQAWLAALGLMALVVAAVRLYNGNLYGAMGILIALVFWGVVVMIHVRLR